MVKKVSIKEVEFSSIILAQKTMDWNEPIPGFETRYPSVLESCLNTPFQKYAKKDLYKGVEGKGAILFYLMVKNHPFQNGNKRIAVATLLLFLYLNNKWLQVYTIELYNFAVWVAESPSDAKDEMFIYIIKFIKKNIVNI